MQQTLRCSGPLLTHKTEETAMSRLTNAIFPGSNIMTRMNHTPVLASGPVEPAEPQPGDEAPPGTSGTGEGLCRECGGRGVNDAGQTCPSCSGTGHITVGIGGA